MATQTATVATGLVFTRRAKGNGSSPKSKKGLGYIWPEIEPALAGKVKALATETGKSISEVAAKLITFALAHSKIQ